MNPIFIMWQGSGSGVPEPPPSPEIVAELTDISRAFGADHGPIHLEPHELRQLRRIQHIAKRDERRAIVSLKIFRKRCTIARAAIRKGVAA